MLVAVRGADRYFNTRSGCNRVEANGANTFVYDRDCGHRHVDSNNRKVAYEEIGEMFEEMLLAGPKNPEDTQPTSTRQRQERDQQSVRTSLTMTTLAGLAILGMTRICADEGRSGIQPKAEEIEPAEVKAEHRVICKQPRRYIGWPTVGRTADGELLVVFSGDRRKPYGQRACLSDDDGQTWNVDQEITL